MTQQQKLILMCARLLWLAQKIDQKVRNDERLMHIGTDDPALWKRFERHRKMIEKATNEINEINKRLIKYLSDTKDLNQSDFKFLALNEDS